MWHLQAIASVHSLQTSCRLPRKLLQLLLLSKNPLTLGFHAFQLGAQFTAFRSQLLNFLRARHCAGSCFGTSGRMEFHDEWIMKNHCNKKMKRMEFSIPLSISSLSRHALPDKILRHSFLGTRLQHVLGWLLRGSAPHSGGRYVAL